jgi:hypothetical protein
MIDVGAVGISHLWEISKPRGRVLRVHKGGSLHIVFDQANSFNHVEK